MNFVYIVMAVHPPVQAPAGEGTEIFIPTPGAFDSEEEAQYAAKKMRDGGNPAWVTKVLKGKYSKRYLRENK
jgi:hypothetical protein